MTTKKMIYKFIRKKGYLYFVDKNGVLWEQKLNKGTTEKMKETIKKNKEERDNEKYF